MAVSTWQWNSAVSIEQECQFNKIERKLFELQVALQTDNSFQQVLLLSKHESSDPKTDKQVSELLTEQSIRVSESQKILEKYRKSGQAIDENCVEIGRIGWSFLALMLIAGGFVTASTSGFWSKETQKMSRKKALRKRLEKKKNK